MTVSGPSRFGSHYIGQYRTCEYQHALAYVVPHPEDATSHGMERWTTSSPLLVGSGVHEGLAAWYKSRCTTGADNGQPDLDLALATLNTHFAERSHEFENLESAAADLALATRLLTAYHDFYGPGGTLPEFPRLSVVVDEHGPVIEREFELQLDGPHIFTARLDGLVQLDGHTYVLEHKTSAASSVGRLITGMGMNTQVLGQFSILHKLMPEHAPEGVLVNVLVKNRSVKSGQPPFDRAVVTFDEADIPKFHADALRTLEDIDKDRSKYNVLAKFLDPFVAARRVYMQRGRSNGACVGFSRCVFLDVCRNPGREAIVARGLKPRTTTAETVVNETENET